MICRVRRNLFGLMVLVVVGVKSLIVALGVDWGSVGISRWGEWWDYCHVDQELRKSYKPSQSRALRKTCDAVNYDLRDLKR